MGRLAMMAVVATSCAASAQTPTPAAEGCAAFAWSVTEAQTAMRGTIAMLVSGGKAAAQDFELALKPMDQVPFPTKPERTPRTPDTFGGFVTIDPPSGKTLQVTLSDEAWIDVVQDGAVVKSGAFSGKQGCESVRKTVRFPLAGSGLVTLQLSGAARPSIRVDIRGVE